MDNNTTSAPVEQKKSFDFSVANGINVQSGIDILGDSETYDSMLKEFHNLSRSKYSKILDDKNKGDMTSYSIEAYSLKVDSNYFGFTTLYNLAKEHQLKASNNDTDYINTHFGELQTELLRIISVLDEFYK